MEAFPTPPEDRRTIELIERLQGDDPSAWDELYRLHHDELLFTVRMNLGTRLRAVMQSEDILQSAAMEAFRAIPKFEDRGQGSLRAFLHRLVLNKIRDRADTFSAQKRSGGVPLTDELEHTLATQEEPRYFDNERFDALERGMNALPAEMREVVLLRKIEGLSGAETAERMGRSEDATRKLYSRAMAKLTLLLSAGNSQ